MWDFEKKSQSVKPSYLLNVSSKLGKLCPNYPSFRSQNVTEPLPTDFVRFFFENPHFLADFGGFSHITPQYRLVFIVGTPDPGQILRKIFGLGSSRKSQKSSSRVLKI